MAKLRFGQYGVKHGHASGKAASLQNNLDVEFAGIYEPDPVALVQAQASPAFAGVHWLRSLEELLGNPAITAVAIEGSNSEGLAMASEAIAAGKHLWYDKPAGDDYAAFERLIAQAGAAALQVQMGYMFRQQYGFRQIAQWVHNGLLGDVFSVRAHMSTSLPLHSPNWTTTGRADVATHAGGMLYDLGGHMLDQIVWLLGRPDRVAAFLRNDTTPSLPPFADNTLGVFEFGHALATVDIAASETPPPARRFEVYGTRGSAIMEPFEPQATLRLCLEQATGGYRKGSQDVPLPQQSRQEMYDLELAALLRTLRNEQPAERPLTHELLVQETLLRATNG